MGTKFRHHDSLRIFTEIAGESSFSDAATALNMTKGAISYQIKTLEEDFGFKIFDRLPRGVVLTPRGKHLLEATLGKYQDIESEIAALKSDIMQTLTVGVSSYFAARWLSPLLMNFLQQYPDIQLRLQPMTQLFNLDFQGLDMAIRWGSGDWDDVEVSPFMTMPAWPVGNTAAAEQVQKMGLKKAFSQFTLLRDHDDSDAWSDWFKASNLPQQTRKDTLIIPDPNVRVQAVIDGQGVALNDQLITQELESGKLVRLTNQELSSYGYFIVRPLKKQQNPCIGFFESWLHEQIASTRLGR